MGTSYHYGPRRRRVLVYSQALPTSPAIDATGTLTIDALAFAGSSDAVVGATGTLALDDASASGSAGVAVTAAGSLPVDGLTVASTADASIAASGSLALDGVTAASTAASTVFASGALDVVAIEMGGSSIASIDASGSLAVDDLTAAGSDQIPGVVPRRVAVPNVSMQSQAGSRRRRVTVYASVAPNSSPISAAQALTRIVVARRPPIRPAPPVSGVVTAQTRVVVGGNPPPNNNAGAGGSPKPLQSSWIVGALWARHPKPLATPVVARTKYVQPPRDGLPNQVTVVSPHRPVQPLASVVVHPSYKWGVNHGKTPNAPVVVRRPVPRRVPAPIVVASPPTSGLGFPAIIDPVVVRYPAGRRARGVLTIYGFADAGERTRPSVVVVARPALKQPAPTIVSISAAEAFAVRPPRPPRPILVPYRKAVRPRGTLTVYGLADAFETPPPFVIAATVVPRHPRASDRIRPPLVVATRPAFNPRAIPVFDPIVVARPVRAKASPWFFISKANLLAPPPPPRHEPTPRTSVVPLPRRRSPLMWPRPIATTSILQPAEDQYDKPWDLIAACIAWLRKDERIVAEFGDVKGSERSRKFVSDVELPGTNPPYAVFDEPMEIESYESADQSGRYSSLVQGSFNLSIFDVEKLAVRRKADMVAASLQDAPLLFTDGVLIYLRRSERRFPTVTTNGVGSNVTTYKRVVEFVYMIERFFNDRKG